LVSHRHITVNGKIVNIPSFSLNPGDTVGVREKSKSLQAISASLEANSAVYEWMTWNSATYEGNFVSIPQRIQIPENIKEQLIVELYSK
jgi:small subunit ribosomal protein S4